jgi:hypothetical protein
VIFTAGLAVALIGALALPAGPAHSTRSPAPAAARGAAPASARLLASGGSSSLPADCTPNPTGPPSHPYQLGFVASVTGSLATGPVAVSGIKAKACGIATVGPSNTCGVTADVNVPQDGQLFAPVKATITVIPGLSPQIPFSPKAQSLTSGLGCESSANGINVTAVAKVGGAAGLFGLTCGVTLTLPLKATILGPLESSGLGLYGTFSGNGTFVLPAITPSYTAAQYCPAGAAAIADKSFGLPLTAPGSSLSLPFHAGVYIPPAP